MRIVFIFLFLILFTGIRAQELTRSGHFKRTVEENFQINHLLTERFNQERLIGIFNGFILLPLDCEAPSVKLRIINSSGNEVYSHVFRQVINLILSSNKKYCAFSDGKMIHYLDLSSFSLKSFSGSTVFAVGENGEAAFYNDENQTIQTEKFSIEVNERIYKMAFLKDQIIFISKKCVLKLDNEKVIPVFCLEEGRMFDLFVDEDNLFVSVKTEVPGGFLFESFKSIDLVAFNFIERQFFPRTASVQKKGDSTFSTHLNQSATGEIIRDPLNYNLDTVYQPIGNSYGEIQFYGNPPYLHPGVDLLGYHLQDVYAIKKGFVKAIITTADTFHWRIAISNVNTPDTSIGYLYAHLDQQTIPFAVDDSVEAGDIIGQLVNFPVQGFVHCHFARIVDSGALWSGGWWTLENPLSSMINFFDTVPPQFEKTIGNDAFAFRDASGFYLSPDSLYGQIKIISKVHDIINSPWKVDVNTIRYNLSSLSVPSVLLLDSFAYEYNFYTDVYPGGSYYPMVLSTLYSGDSTCFSDGDYNIRDFFHIVTNSDGNDTLDGNDSLQFFNTANFPDGSYIFRIIASDPSGNSSMDSMVVRFKNNINNVDNVHQLESVVVYPNPSKDGKFTIQILNNNHQEEYEIYNTLGEKVFSGKIDEGINRFYIYLPAKGFYFLRMLSGGKDAIRKMIVY